MKEKREAALKEIKRLTGQIDLIKSQQLKKNDVSLENSYGHLPDSNNHQLKMSSYSVEKIGTNVSSLDTSNLFKSNTTNKITLEGNYLCILKKDLENLYRDFIPLIPWDIEKKQQASFIKLERKMNDCIQKAQDLIDTIEDMH